MAAGALQAKTAEELRIYLNPGHGSYGPNDRPMSTIGHPQTSNLGDPDTLGFYEGRGTLPRAFGIGSYLKQVGVKPENIVYSRLANGPWPYTGSVSTYDPEETFNRPLSEICEEVEAGNFDMFISSHSNAATDGTTTNYPLYLYRGQDGAGGDQVAGSRDMANTTWPYHHMNTDLEPQTAYTNSTNIRGDWDFYGSHSVGTRSNGKQYDGYLGVLKHGTPGYLLEGYFHTYQPARHRALNFDYDRVEGIREARGVAAYFGLEQTGKGEIMGTVKDMHEKISHNLFKYAPRTNDQWLPLNGAVVKLLKDGQEVASYTVDNEYNGIFVFYDLEPGEYTLEASCEGYKALLDEYKPVTVKANDTAWPLIYLESESYEPPAIVYENYPDPDQPVYMQMPSEFIFDGENTQNFEIAGRVTDVAQRGDSTIILSNDGLTPHLYLVKSDTQELIKELSVEGIYSEESTGFYSPLYSLAFTADGKLVGSSLTRNQYGVDNVDAGYTRGTTRLYIWNDFDSAPALWVTSQSSVNYYRANVGQSLAINGPSNDCTVHIVGVNQGASPWNIRLLHLGVADGNVVSSYFDNLYSAGFTATKYGDDVQGGRLHLAISPNDDSKVILGGSNGLIAEFTAPATEKGIPSDVKMLSEDFGLVGYGFNCFKYAKHAVMVAPYAEDGVTKGIKFLDITDGVQNAQLIKTNTDLTIEQAAPMRKAPADVTTATHQAATAVVKGEQIDAYLASDFYLTRFTTQGVQQEAVKGIFAYGLTDTKLDDGYKFDFNANSDAESAKLIFTDKETGEVLGEVEVSNVKEGANSITLSLDELPGEPGQEMNWAVNLVGKNIPTIALLNDLNDFNYEYTFNTVDNSPESDYFGRIYIGHRPGNTDANNGLWIYNPDWTKHNESVIKTRTDGLAFRSNYRIGIDCEGKVYMPDWGDPSSGVFVFDPANEDGGFYPFFAHADGTPLNREASGLLTNDEGVAVGGSSPGVFVYGSGADSKLYVYNEDVPTGNNSNNVSVYNIGNEDGTLAKYWDKAPDFTDHIGPLQANTNGNVWAMSNGGYWVAQYRGAGNNNAGVPSLIFVNAEGEVVFNSGSDTDFVNNYLNGSNGSGFAVSKDEKTLVINDGNTELRFFDIEWNNGVPSLVHKYVYTGIKNSGIPRGGLVYQMNFDYAGNLIVSGAKVGIYSIPTDDNQTTVPAKKALIVVKPVLEPAKYYVTGSFNGWDKVNPVEMVDDEATIDMEDNVEFKLVTPDPQAEDGWKWIGGVDENQAGFFLVTEDMMAGATEIDLTDGSNFKIEKGGNFTLKIKREEAATPAGMAKAPGDAIKLVVVRNNITGVDDLSAKAVASVKYVNMAGQVSDRPFDGVNLVVTKFTDGTTSTVKVVK